MEGTSAAFTSPVSNHYGYINHRSSTTSNTTTVQLLAIRIAMDFQCICDCVWRATATWWKAFRHIRSTQDLHNRICNSNCSISCCRSSIFRNCSDNCKSASRYRCGAHRSICALHSHEPLYHSCREK
jgi:hypothetical protein